MMFAALYLPDFELQAALRHEPELHQQPVALLDNEEAKATILQLTKSAADAGVSLGMTTSQGLARCLRLIIKPRAFAQEKIANKILLQHAATLAPEIEATAPGVCTVHFTSTKNCRDNVERVVRQLAQLQLTAQAGLAATPDLSFLAARLAPFPSSTPHGVWPPPDSAGTERASARARSAAREIPAACGDRR
jgi:nucleotidyltransferase/DNA polymerase involved in DNA repair